MNQRRAQDGAGNGAELTLECKSVHHAFARPLATAHGAWSGQKYLLVRLTRGERSGYGEMAPLKGFSGPELGELEALCGALGPHPERARLEERNLPGCAAFAFASALAMLDGKRPRAGQWPLARLLPFGPHSLFEAAAGIRAGSRCFKYKLRGLPDDSERNLLAMLFDTLRACRGRLRIDCNGSLPDAEAADCLAWLAKEGGKALDFVEQPLPPGDEARMRSLMNATGAKIALDESVSSAESLDRWMDWAGPLVVKPALCGSPTALARRLDARHGRTVLSSAFNGPVGLYGILLAIGRRVPEPIGLAADIWPQGDPWGRFCGCPSIDPSHLGIEELEAVWTRG